MTGLQWRDRNLQFGNKSCNCNNCGWKLTTVDPLLCRQAACISPSHRTGGWEVFPSVTSPSFTYGSRGCGVASVWLRRINNLPLYHFWGVVIASGVKIKGFYKCIIVVPFLCVFISGFDNYKSFKVFDILVMFFSRFVHALLVRLCLSHARTHTERGFPGSLRKFF